MVELVASIDRPVAVMDFSDANEAAFLKATLDALPAYVVVLDEDRTVLAGNAAWHDFVGSSLAEQSLVAQSEVAQPAVADSPSSVGQDYLAVIESLMSPGPEVLDQIAERIEAVVAGSADYAWLEYCCTRSCAMRWYVMHVTRFQVPAGSDPATNPSGFRLVIAHHDMTERKRAEQALNAAREAAETGRLEEQARAQEAAALAERNRLARDLHDAVTQTLFSASIMAEALPRVWDRDPEEGKRRLDELRQLTRGALAEMRALLLELRPAALSEKSLSSLLRHLADVMTSRTLVPVAFNVSGMYDPAPNVKIAFYRIAQEALNNIAKHSGANQVALDLHCDAGRVMLSLADNGSGFDTGSTLPDQLGLAIMRERAEAIGANLQIESQPGHGTLVGIVWHE
jgi:signal transduction histidine kinase